MSDLDDRRGHLRYNPERNSIVSVSAEPEDNSEGLIGLLLDISGGGCGAIFHQEFFDFEIGQTVYITTEEHKDLEASIVWVRNIEKRALKAGFEFSETLNV